MPENLPAAYILGDWSKIFYQKVPKNLDKICKAYMPELGNLKGRDECLWVEVANDFPHHLWW